MSEKKLKLDSEEEDDDDDFCPTKAKNEQSDASDESNDDDKGDDNSVEQTHNKNKTDLDVTPYDESKTNELWRSFSSSSSKIKDPPKSTTEIPKPQVQSQKPATPTIQVFEYAGEKVSVPVTTANPSLKRPAASSTTVNSVLDRLGIGKKQKLSTLEKSRLDWSVHKESEAITEDLDSHRRSKDSYVERKAFLERSEVREHDHFLTNVKKK